MPRGRVISIEVLLLFVNDVVFGQNARKFSCSKNISGNQPFCFMPDYRSDIKPDTGESALDIFVHLNTRGITEINDDDATITLALTLSITWIEPRLHLLSNSSEWIIEEDDLNWATLNQQWLDYFWKPDMDIANIKEFKTKSLLKKQGSFELYENKRIWYDFPVEITLACPLFNFDNYPLDQQVCELVIGSYEYNAKEMTYSGDIYYDKKNQRSLQYEVKDVTVLEKSIFSNLEYWMNKNMTIENGYFNYSYFAVRIELDRLIQPHIFRTYLPSCMFVVSSWIGFVISHDAVPGRIALSAMLLLVLIGMR